jgi:hypothetical protein
LQWTRDPDFDEKTIAEALRRSPALQKLKRLGLFIPAYTLPDYGDWNAFFSAITGLALLEHLELQLPISVEWCRHFEKCSRLRKIEWTLPTALRTALEDGIYDVLMASLRHLYPAPLVTFALDEWDDPDKWRVEPYWEEENEEYESDEESEEDEDG